MISAFQAVGRIAVSAKPVFYLIFRIIFHHCPGTAAGNLFEIVDTVFSLINLIHSAQFLAFENISKPLHIRPVQKFHIFFIAHQSMKSPDTGQGAIVSVMNIIFETDSLSLQINNLFIFIIE